MLLVPMRDERNEGRGRWQISPARRLALRSEDLARCAECKTPAFAAFGDHVALRAWILEHRKELAAELRDYFRKNPELHPRPDHWFGLLTMQLRAEVVLAWERSALEPVSAIPLDDVAAREDAGALVPEALRAFLVDGFVAPVCGACRTLLARPPRSANAVRERYARWFFDGDAKAAQRTDPVRWELLEDAIAHCLIGERDLALVSERGK
ncbi:MAG: hypothetical protein JO036_04870 [Candidatus Eremiobacteraeota bacterium]|nr:hypothetical protein [Candidatus Eremiobacteraeota bacterium]